MDPGARGGGTTRPPPPAPSQKRPMARPEIVWALYPDLDTVAKKKNLSSWPQNGNYPIIQPPNSHYTNWATQVNTPTVLLRNHKTRRTSVIRSSSDNGTFLKKYARGRISWDCVCCNIYLRGFGSSGDVALVVSFSKRFPTFRRIVALSISRERIAGEYSFTPQTTRKLNTTTLRTLYLVVFAVFGEKFKITWNHWKRIYFHNLSPHPPPSLFKLVAGGRRGYADYSSNRLLVYCFRGFLPWWMTLM